MISINNFCGKLDPRFYFNEPFVIDGHTAASNGHVFICGPLDGGHGNLPDKNKKAIIRLIEKTENCTTAVPPVFNLPELESCSACDGCGKATVSKCETCDGDGDCSSCGEICRKCNGDGEIIRAGGDEECFECHGAGKFYNRYKHVEVCGVLLNPNYLALIAGEQDLQVGASDDGNMLVFSTGKYKGAIMGVAPRSS